MFAVGNKVILKPLLDKKEGRLEIVQAVDDPIKKGEIVSVGPDCKYVEKGQKVYFSHLLIDEVDEYYVLDERDILATIE